MDAPPEIAAAPAPAWSGRLLIWLPIPILLVATLAAGLAGPPPLGPAPALMSGLNLVVAVLASAAVATLFGRAFLDRRAVSLLLWGCGVLVWGSDGSMDLILDRLVDGGASPPLAIHNAAAWLSAACHLAATVLAQRRRPPLAWARLWLTVAYGLSLAAVTGIVLAAFSGWMPAALAHEQGGVSVRNLVMGSAVAMFGLSAILLWTANRAVDSPFARWYAPALLLLAIGFLGSLLQPLHGGPVCWLGHTTHWLGTGYLFLAARAASRDSAAIGLADGQRPTSSPPAARYPVAIVLAVGGAVVRLVLLSDITLRATYITFFPAVMLAALYGGLGAGLLATVVSTLLADYFLIEPIGQLTINDSGDALGCLVFVINCLLISGITEAMHRARAGLLAHQERLEETIAVRTRDLRVSNTRRALLAEIAGRLLKSESPQGVVEELCRKVMAVLDCQVFFNFLAEPRVGKLHLNAWAGIGADEAKRIEWLDYGVAVCGCAARDHCRIIAEDIPNTPDPRTELVKGYGITAYVCHPLLGEGKVIGTLSFGTSTRSRFTDEEIALLAAVTDQVAIAMFRQQATEALFAGKERLRLVLNASQIGTFEYDLTTGEGQWNEVEYGLLGLAPAEVQATPETLFRFVHADDRELSRLRWNKALLTGELDTEFRIVRPDGAERWLAMKGRLLFSPPPTPPGEGLPWGVARRMRFLGVNYDITERKRAEEQLRDLSLRLSYHVDNSPLAVIEWGPDMRLIRWSGEAERIFGWKAEEVLGKRMEDFRWIHPEDAPLVAEVFDGLQDGTMPRVFSANRNYRKDGSVVHCEWYNSSLVDASGKLCSILSLVQDVTDRTRAEEALRDSEFRFYTLANAMPQLAWIARADGHISWYNQRWYEYTGTRPEQMTGWGWQQVHDPERLPAVLDGWQRSLTSGQPFEMEFPLRGADGAFRQFLTRAFPLKDGEGRVVSWFGTNTDVSERKLAEERLQASLHEKEVLLKEIHHRVKNNLQVISSLVDLQADAIGNPELSGVFQEVRDRVRSMALVHEKLYSSDNLVRVDFSEYVTSLLHYLWRSHDSLAGNIGLRLDLQPVLLAVEAAVPCGLLLNELAVNALKHAFGDRERGEVVVRLHLEPGGEVCLVVSDNGVGLPAGLDWRQSRSLGLNLVRMLTSQLKAAVEVTSEGGTTFRIVFTPRESSMSR